MALALTPPLGGTQSSNHPDIMEDVAATPSPRLVTAPAWQHSWFVAAEHGQLIDSDSDTAYFSSSNSVCAVRLADGKDRWCSGSAASSVALAGNTLATVESDGFIRTRDKRTGTGLLQQTIAQADFGVAQAQSAVSTASPASQAGVGMLWSTGRTFFEVLRGPGRGSMGPLWIGEKSPDGHELWKWSGTGDTESAPLFSSPYAIVKMGGSAIGATSQTLLFRLGAQGGYVGVIDANSDPILFKPPALYSLETSGVDPLEFQISVTAVQPGVTRVEWEFQPDYDQNEKLPVGATCCGKIAKRVGIEGRFLYGSVFEHLYRYDLAAPQEQQPILLSDRGQFVAGPYAARGYVGRPDGVWSVHFNGRYVYQRLVIPYRLPTVLALLEFDGRVGYAALTDGTMIAFSLDTGEPLIRAKSSCTSFVAIEITKSKAIYLCGAPAPVAIAFPRVTPPL